MLRVPFSSKICDGGWASPPPRPPLTHEAKVHHLHQRKTKILYPNSPVWTPSNMYVPIAAFPRRLFPRLELMEPTMIASLTLPDVPESCLYVPEVWLSGYLFTRWANPSSADALYSSPLDETQSNNNIASDNYSSIKIPLRARPLIAPPSLGLLSIFDISFKNFGLFWKRLGSPLWRLFKYVWDVSAEMKEVTLPEVYGIQSFREIKDEVGGYGGEWGMKGGVVEGKIARDGYAWEEVLLRRHKWECAKYFQFFR